MTMTIGISTVEAQQLWSRLHQHFLNFELTLKEIIEKRAWEPMGYESFAEAWTAQMSDITLAAELRPHVVYAYYDSGATDEEVLFGVKGVGPNTLKNLKRERSCGVPPSAARGTSKPSRDGVIAVGPYERRPATPKGVLALELGTLKLERFDRIAKRHGLSTREVALAAIEEKFKALDF